MSSSMRPTSFGTGLQDVQRGFGAVLDLGLPALVRDHVGKGAAEVTIIVDD